jgi:hypothetical protein
VIPYIFFVFLMGYDFITEGIILCGTQVCNVLHNNDAGITYNPFVVAARFAGI